MYDQSYGAIYPLVQLFLIVVWAPGCYEVKHLFNQLLCVQKTAIYCNSKQWCFYSANIETVFTFADQYTHPYVLKEKKAYWVNIKLLFLQGQFN